MYVYMGKQNNRKSVIRREEQNRRKESVNSIEYDAHGRQKIAYKLVSYLNEEESITSQET